jgi:hypothetical protein
MPAEKPRKGAWRNLVAAVVILVPIVAILAYSTMQVGAHECEVCMAFEGREICRTVAASSEQDAHRGAVDNACALLTSGMTNTLRCSRTPPRSARCR